MLAECVKEWNKESMERGLQKGLQQGLQKGLEKGALQLLMHLLETKFGNLPQDLVLRLKQADEEQILQWSGRILTADTLGDIFGN